MLVYIVYKHELALVDSYPCIYEIYADKKKADAVAEERNRFYTPFNDDPSYEFWVREREVIE